MSILIPRVCLNNNSHYYHHVLPESSYIAVSSDGSQKERCCSESESGLNLNSYMHFLPTSTYLKKYIYIDAISPIAAFSTVHVYKMMSSLQLVLLVILQCANGKTLANPIHYSRRLDLYSCKYISVG